MDQTANNCLPNWSGSWPGIQLLYLDMPLEPWTLWFLALMDRLDSPQYLEVCHRLMMPERLMERIFGHRHNALKRLQHLRQILGRGQEISNSQLYAGLYGMPVETVALRPGSQWSGRAAAAGVSLSDSTC